MHGFKNGYPTWNTEYFASFINMKMVNGSLEGGKKDHITFQIHSLNVLNLLKVGLMDQATFTDLNLNVIQHHENRFAVIY